MLSSFKKSPVEQETIGCYSIFQVGSLSQNQCIFIIRWDGGAKDTYLYRTELDWNRQGPIRFANRFLPSGQAIRT